MQRRLDCRRLLLCRLTITGNHNRYIFKWRDLVFNRLPTADTGATLPILTRSKSLFFPRQTSRDSFG